MKLENNRGLLLYAEEKVGQWSVDVALSCLCWLQVKPPVLFRIEAVTVKLLQLISLKEKEINVVY